jgi:hypothetical protein
LFLRLIFLDFFWLGRWRFRFHRLLKIDWFILLSRQLHEVLDRHRIATSRQIFLGDLRRPSAAQDMGAVGGDDKCEVQKNGKRDRQLHTAADHAVADPTHADHHSASDHGDADDRSPGVMKRARIVKPQESRCHADREPA